VGLHRLVSEAPPIGRVASAAFYPWLVVGTVCIGAFLGQLDASIAGLVLPTLETTFRAPLANVEWVAIAYLLVLAALVVPFGRLSDLTGRKMLYTSGFLIFVLGSTLCGLAADLSWLIV
jgi:MFS family permease